MFGWFVSMKLMKKEYFPYLTIVVLLWVVGFLAFRNYKLKRAQGIKNQNQSKNCWIPKKTEQKKIETFPTLTVTQIPTKTPEKQSFYYGLKIRLKTVGIEPPLKIPFLDQYLAKLFDFPVSEGWGGQRVAPKIVYDIRKGNPYPDNVGNQSKFNFDYFLISDGVQIDVSRTYEDEYTKLEVYELEDYLKPYLDSSKYCQSDSDCVVRTSFCKYGSFNHYQRFQDVWGCSGYEDETGYFFGGYNKELGCNTRVKYKNSSCINNNCVGQNRIIYCKTD